MSGDDFDFHCHSNPTRAILPYKLTESDVHDVINLFQVTGLNKNGEYFMYVFASHLPNTTLPLTYLTTLPREPSPATKTTYIEFFAEIDVLCALSTCPGGDLSLWGWGEGKGGNMLDCCRPLGVEVYSLNDREKVLAGWKEPESPKYRGLHGLGMPVFKEGEGGSGR